MTEKLINAMTRNVIVRTIDEHPEVFDMMSEAIKGVLNGTINTFEEYENVIKPAIDIVDKLKQEEEENAEKHDNAAD